MSQAAERVLEALRSAGDCPCSGAALSEALGVTRAQVWKHVETLRDRGYRIIGAPGGGYRLETTPDRLYPEELRARASAAKFRAPATPARHWLAQELRYLDDTDSTNRVAFDWARNGAPHGAAVVAEGQTAGRGRLGRAFFSPPYQNLYTSLVLRPEMLLHEAPTVVLVAALAVADCAAGLLGGPETVSIKWPNDVLLRGRKTSGILMELSAEATRVGFLVLGIGVNLNVDPGSFPAEFRQRATSLRAETGSWVDRARFTRTLYDTLEQMLDLHAAAGFDALRGRFEAYFRMAGEPVRVTNPGGASMAGTAEGIDSDGALLLRREDGSQVRLLAGDVTLAKEGGQ